MNKADQPARTLPEGRRLEEFLDDAGRLHPAEQKLLDACARGDTAIVASERPAIRTQANSIRAAFVRFLCLSDGVAAIHEHGIRIQGAWIDGELDLENCAVPFELTLQQCTIDGGLVLRDASILNLNLAGSSAGAISADRLECRGSVQLVHGFDAGGSITLTGARIGGNLECDGSRFTAPPGSYALVCEGIEVGGNVMLREGFRSRGGVGFIGAKIGGSLVCNSGKFAARGAEHALSCEQATIGGTVYLAQGFFAAGFVSLRGMSIGRYLMCSGGRFRATGANPSLACDQAAVGGNADFSGRFHAKGAVLLFGTRLGGELNCNGGTFRATSSAGALRADGADIKGSVFFAQGFTASGTVALNTARIGGDLNCGGGKFSGPVVAGKQDWALLGGDVSIGGSLSLSDGFQAAGGVVFHGTSIAGNLDCAGGNFEGSARDALSLERSRISGYFFFRKVAAVSGRMSLIALHAATLVDDLKSWQKASSVILDGFRYDRFAGDGDPGNFGSNDRVKWLEKQSMADLTTNFKSQPWEHLARVLREAGYLEEAKDVAIRRQGWMHRSIHSRIVRPLHQAYGFFFAYGYRPERILWRASVAWLVCAAVFAIANHAGLIVPADVKVLEDKEVAKECASNWTGCAAVAERYAPYSSLLYSLDLILPISALDQTKVWKVNTVQRCKPVLGVCLGGAATPAGTRAPGDFGWSPAGVGVAALARLENLFGWLAGLVLVGLATGLMKKG